MNKEVNIDFYDSVNTSLNALRNNFFNKIVLVNGNQWSDFKDCTKKTMFFKKGYETGKSIKIGICIKTFQYALFNGKENMQAGDIVIIKSEFKDEALKMLGDINFLWLDIRYSSIVLNQNNDTEAGTYEKYCITFNDSQYLLREIRNEITSRPKDFDITLKAQLIELLVKIKRKQEASIEYSITINNRSNMLIYDIIQHINQNYTRNVRLNELAKEFSICANHLNKLFKASTGNTVMQYVEDLKIEKAKILLSRGDMTVRYIAHELSFFDQSHFTKTFKKRTGYSPGEYKSNTVYVG